MLFAYYIVGLLSASFAIASRVNTAKQGRASETGANVSIHRSEVKIADVTPKRTRSKGLKGSFNLNLLFSSSQDDNTSLDDLSPSSRDSGCSTFFKPKKVAEYIGLDYCAFITKLHAVGYKVPLHVDRCGYYYDLKAIRSCLDTIVMILDSDADDNHMFAMLEELESELIRLKEDSPGKMKKYRKPLQDLRELLPVAKNRASEVWYSRVAAVNEKATCSEDGLPCGLLQPECALDSIAVVSRLSQDMSCFNPIMTFKATPRYSQSKLEITKFSKEEVIALSREHPRIDVIIRDHVAHEDPITLNLDFEPYWTATLEKVQKTQCSLAGGEMIDWMISTLREMGFQRLYLEDDARVQCDYDHDEIGEEAPLRLLYMLKAEQPSESKGFYEAKGFTHVAGEDYEASKELLNMDTIVFRDLLKCTDEKRGNTQRTAKRALRNLEKNLGKEDETMFQWLKRNNELSRQGDRYACKRTTAVANCFWRRNLIWSSPFRKRQCMHLDEERIKAWEKLSIFGAEYKKLLFVKELQLESQGHENTVERIESDVNDFLDDRASHPVDESLVTNG